MPDFHITPDDTAVLLIDVQERFQAAIPSIAEDHACGRALATLLQGANLLECPITVSRQYPQGLGDTLPFLQHAAPEAVSFDKTTFSCCDDETLRLHLAEQERNCLIIAGIEAHICVLATVDDALRRGWRVVVAANAVASRNPEHCAHAIATMRQMGAIVLPVESILFRLQKNAAGPVFKALSKLVK